MLKCGSLHLLLWRYKLKAGFTEGWVGHVKKNWYMFYVLYTHTRTHEHTHAHTHINTHTHIYTHAHTHTHTHAHTRTLI